MSVAPDQSTSPQQGGYQPTQYQQAPRTQGAAHNQEPAARSTETKASFKTTELIVYVVAVVAVLVASLVVDDSNGGPDVFTAGTAWFYITLLTIGYMISRGLAKAGSRENSSS